MGGRARLAPLAFAVVLALVLPTARADDPPALPAPPGPRLVLAMRLGLEAAFGEPQQSGLGDADVADYTPLTMPIALSALAQYRSGFELGGGVAIAPGFEHPAGDAPGADASSARALVVRTGVELARHFRPNASFDPWIGAGLSAQLLRYAASVGQVCSSNGDCYRVVDVRARYLAMPELSVALGLDYGGDRWRVGPVLRVGGAAFARVRRSYTFDDPERTRRRQHDSYDGEDTRAWHGYVFVGVRGSFRR